MRQFCLGVLGWAPENLRHACLPDIADAFLGYAARHGHRRAPGITTDFLQDMLRRFPDKKG